MKIKEVALNYFVLGIKVTDVKLKTFFTFFSIKTSMWSFSVIYTHIN